jgi:hypothetical protein
MSGLHLPTFVGGKGSFVIYCSLVHAICSAVQMAAFTVLAGLSRRLLMMATECGVLRCQRDSYLKSLDTVVVQCLPSSPEEQQHGSYALQLEDTVLFPEGGGQVGWL